jgi:hypothetical protein
MSDIPMMGGEAVRQRLNAIMTKHLGDGQEMRYVRDAITFDLLNQLAMLSWDDVEVAFKEGPCPLCWQSTKVPEIGTDQPSLAGHEVGMLIKP